MHAGVGQQRAAEADLALAALHGLFHQRRFDQVVIDIAQPFDPLGLKAVGRVHVSIGHLQAPECRGGGISLRSACGAVSPRAVPIGPRKDPTVAL
jgi:hypothetical protein